MSIILWPIVLPLAGAPLAFLVPRAAAAIGVVVAAGELIAATGLSAQVWQNGPQHHIVGGWSPPLGIGLQADGLTAVMVSMSALVGAAISLYAVGYYARGTREGESFWPLWLFLWAALNALFLSADLFNHYVTLELIGLSSAALVTLTGQRAALTAAMRYLLVSLLGSLFFLLGVAILYAAFGTLAVDDLRARLTSGEAASAAIAAMTIGLLLKTALFPLHFWLPPAHANAPAPVSAALSALVVKASYYLLLRLWFDVFPAAVPPAANQLLGVLGAAAILWGSLLALRQRRLKLLVAYSTVAQVGYLFLVFPLGTITAWRAAVLHIVMHACAKAAMFMAAGNVVRVVDDDAIDRLHEAARHAPLSIFAFALGGVTLMGMPPSGGFAAKWLLLTAAVEGGHTVWVVVAALGGLLTAGYVFRVLRRAFVQQPAPASQRTAPRVMEWTALGLALLAILLGFAAPWLMTLMDVGAPMLGDAALGSNGRRGP